MTIRDLPETTRKRMLTEGVKAFAEWYERTQGLTFNTKEPLPLDQVWNTAFSLGVSCVLKRITKLD